MKSWTETVSIRKRGGGRFPLEFYKHRVYFILSLLFALQPIATQLFQALIKQYLKTPTKMNSSTTQNGGREFQLGSLREKEQN